MKSTKLKTYFSIAIIISLAIGLLIHLNAILGSIAPMPYVINSQRGGMHLINNVFITFLVSFCTFLLNYFIIKPLDSNKKTSFKSAIFAVMLTLISVYILSNLFHSFMHILVNRDVRFHFNIIFLIGELIIASIVLGGIFVIKIIYDRQTIVLENERLTRENLQSQYESLKNHISPHFLFNSLSALKSLINENSEKAQSYVDHLSQVLRYSIQNQEHKTVTLKDELEVLNSYKYLLSMRYESNLSIEVEIQAEYHDYRLPQLALQTLVENAVKHNVISNRYPLQINIYTQQDQVIVVNNIKEKISPELGNGIGLANLVNQYQLLGDRPIEITKTEEIFRVNLPLLNPL